MTVTETAHAKINIALNITGTNNGMHCLDSLFIPANIADTVHISTRQDAEINVTYGGKPSPHLRDTAKLTAQLLQKEYRTSGVDIEIEKRIPVMGGLGGSSADAGAVARGMEKLFGYRKTDLSLLHTIGSDVPYAYLGGEQRVRGTGELLSKVALPKFYIALVFCTEGVGTKDCFDLYDKIGGESCSIDNILEQFSRRERVQLKNALFKAASQINGDVVVGLSALESSGFMCGMTGSGSTLFGIEYEEDRFSEQLADLRSKIEKRFTIYTFFKE